MLELLGHTVNSVVVLTAKAETGNLWGRGQVLKGDFKEFPLKFPRVKHFTSWQGGAFFLNLYRSGAI